MPVYYFEPSQEIKQSIENNKLIVSAVKCTNENDYYPRNLSLFLLNLETAKTAKVVAYAPEIVGDDDFDLNGAVVKELNIWKTFKNSIYTPDVIVVKSITLERDGDIVVIDGLNVERGTKVSSNSQQTEKYDKPEEESEGNQSESQNEGKGENHEG